MDRNYLISKIVFLAKCLDWHALVWVFIPYRTKEFYQNLITTLRSIQDGHKERIFQQRLIHWMLVVSSINLMLIGSLHKSRYTSLVLSDIFTIFGFPATIPFHFAAIFSTTIYMFKVIYFDSIGKLVAIKMAEVFVGNNQYIFHSTKPIVSWGMGLANAYQILTIGVDGFSVYSYFYMLTTLCTYKPWQTFSGIFCVLCFHLFFGLLIFPLAAYLHIGCICAVLGFFSIAILFTRIEETSRRYLSPVVDRKTRFRLLIYFRHNIETMRYLGSMNQIYEPVVTLFLISNVPVNCSLLISIVTGKFNSFFSIFCSLFVAGQMTAIFAFHILSAHVSKRLHAPWRKVIGHSIRMPAAAGAAGHSRTCFTIAKNIEAFHTKRKYGINYQVGTKIIGLISMSAFIKFLFFYSKLCMSGFRNNL